MDINQLKDPQFQCTFTSWRMNYHFTGLRHHFTACIGIFRCSRKKYSEKEWPRNSYLKSEQNCKID